MSFEEEKLQDLYRTEYRRWRTQMMKEEAGFFALYQDFLPMLSALSAPALRLYLYLGMHSNNWTGESWHSLAKMANELHMDPRTVRRALQELTDQGLIARVQRSPRAPTYTYLRPLARNRPLMGKALEEIAETILKYHGFSIVNHGIPLPTTRRQADFLVVNAAGEQRLVEVKYRVTLDDLMTWANVARRAQLGLIMLTAEPWDYDVELAAKDMDVLLFLASRSDDESTT